MKAWTISHFCGSGGIQVIQILQPGNLDCTQSCSTEIEGIWPQAVMMYVYSRFA